MPRAVAQPLPDLTPERLLDRIAEAMQVGRDPTQSKKFPAWTRRVMGILKEQFVPREFTSILSADGSILAEGIAVAWVAKAQDLAQARPTSSGRFALKLAERLAMDAETKQVAEQVEAGAFGSSDDFQTHVMRRLFSPDFTERRAFVEGLAIGNRLPELLDRQARRSTTDATGIYLLLWFYWPEISALRSVREVATALEPFFAENKNLAGAHWDERIRKLANRIGLSFRAKQNQARKKRLK
jgi:hypothetical protein